jgi:hypothetical protein
VAFWTNVYTPETWSVAGEREHDVAGFPPPTAGRGGYYESHFNAVQVGDILACYVKAPAMRWTGMLEVTSPWYLDTKEAIWGVDDEGLARFPARFKTKPLIAVEADRGLPVSETVGVLTCLIHERGADSSGGL